jgi:hypothetical protein
LFRATAASVAASGASMTVLYRMRVGARKPLLSDGSRKDGAPCHHDVTTRAGNTGIQPAAPYGARM